MEWTAVLIMFPSITPLKESLVVSWITKNLPNQVIQQDAELVESVAHAMGVMEDEL